MIRIGIVGQHRIIRWALHEALARVPGMEIVGEAGTVEETLAMVHRVTPDVLLLDITLDHAGEAVLAAIRDLETGPLVVVLAAQLELNYAARAIAAGVHGYIGKSAEPEQLLDAIRAVSRGERVIPPGVEALIAADDPANVLTKRELQVMEMIARSMSNREIAEHLDISLKTIDTHRGHVLKKLGLRNNSELTRFAVRHRYAPL